MSAHKLMGGWRYAIVASAVLLVGCSGEPMGTTDEHAESQTFAAITSETMAATTPPPPIPLNQITFTITTPSAPTFLGTLYINGLPPAAGGVIGSVAPGGASASMPAVHSFRLGSAKFQQIRQFLLNNQGPLSIQVTYDNLTFLATDLNPFVMLL